MEKRGAGKWGEGRKEYFYFFTFSHYLKFRSLAMSTFLMGFFLKGEKGRSEVMPSISPSEDETSLKK